jgi:hypothetical protein
MSYLKITEIFHLLFLFVFPLSSNPHLRGSLLEDREATPVSYSVFSLLYVVLLLFSSLPSVLSLSIPLANLIKVETTSSLIRPIAKMTAASV